MGLCDKVRPPKKRRKPRPHRQSMVNPCRVRSRIAYHGESGSKTFTVNHVKADPSPCPFPTVNPLLKTYEEIQDVVGNLQGWHNPVTHVKYNASGLRRPENGALLSVADCQVCMDTCPIPDPYYVLVDNLQPIDPVIVHELLNSSQSHFLEAVQPEVLLLNFILEMLNLCKDAAELVEHLAFRWKDILRVYQKKLKELLKTGLSDWEAHWLAFQFAILPNLGDLRKIRCSIEAAQKRVRWLAKNADKQVRVHYRRGNVVPPPDSIVCGVPPTHIVGPWNPSCPPWQAPCAQPDREGTVGFFRLVPVEWDVTYSAQAWVQYRLPPCRFKDGSGIGMVWASMMAVDRLGSVVWEAIPFSFVIDWFTDIGKQAAAWLDARTKNFEDGLISTSGHSFKLTSMWQLQLVVGTPCGAPRFHNLGAPVSYTKYVRREGLPVTDLSYTFEPTGLTESGRRTSLGAALIVQRYKKAKRILKRKKRVKLGR